MKLILSLTILVAAANALSDSALWAEFKVQHGKEYKPKEEILRFQTFQNNLRLIDEHNEKYQKGEVGYFLKVTPYADWTDEEFADMLKQQAASKPELNATGIHEVDPNVIAPDAVDWRKQNAVTGVKSQGVCGGCWSFSVTGQLEGQLAIHKNQHTLLSEQELIDCSGKYGNQGCNGGDQYFAFEYVRDNGLGASANYPFTGRDGSCRNVQKVVSRVSQIKRVSPDENSLANAVATIGPISVSADASQWKLYGGGIFDLPNCLRSLNHAILAVGYTKDYWIIKNSWGIGWGELGYMRMYRNRNICGIANDNSYALL